MHGVNSLWDALCKPWPTSVKETYMLSLPSIVLQCGYSQCNAKCIPGVPSCKWKPRNIARTIRHASAITTCQTEIFQKCLHGNTPNLHFIFSPAFEKIHFKFPSPPTATSWHFSWCSCTSYCKTLIERHWEGVKACQSSALEALFCQNFRAAAFNIHHFFSLMWVQDTSATTDFEDLILLLQRMSNTKNGLSGLYVLIWTLSLTVCFRSGMEL